MFVFQIQTFYQDDDSSQFSVLSFRNHEYSNSLQNITLMLGEITSTRNHCFQCNLNFDTPYELQNHKRRFCLNSGYDNLQGLAKMQWQGTSPPQKPSFSHKNHLQSYGSHSLTRVGQYRQLTQDNLERDMKNIDKFKRQLEGARKYKHGEPSVSQANSVKSKLDASKLTQNSYSQSVLEEQLKRYEKIPKQSVVSPPTFIDQLNMKNHTILDKSNSSLGRMPLKDRIEYAKIKMDELTEIKQMYIQNGGKKPQFKANVEKMINFYQKFLAENQEKYKKEDQGNYFNQSQQMIQSRCSTPILKLRNFQEKSKGSGISNATAKRAKTSKADQNQKKNEGPSQNYGNGNMINGMNFGYPGSGPIFMMPYPQPPPSQSTDSLKVLEKMIELKSEENKKLLQIMLEDRKRANEPPKYQIPVPEASISGSFSSPSKNTNRSKKGVIDVQEEYQFKKSMIQDLISQEKVLLALQQEELDELKMLSQLPSDLQQIKLQSVIKSSETRHQVEKELLKQKMQRLAYQGQNQTFEQDRKMNNDRWAGQERKRLLEQQMGRYLDNFEEQMEEP